MSISLITLQKTNAKIIKSQNKLPIEGCKDLREEFQHLNVSYIFRILHP